jgi:hypothetical protein
MSELEIQDVNGSEWDYLIVLDACRYDYFEKHYDDFLEGNLEKKRSKGTQTPEWLRKTFTSRYNYTYIAANPYVNSYNSTIEKEGEVWNPTKTFTRIIDSWDIDWSDEHHTVHPSDITDTAVDELGSGKAIIHYLQPHRPYITSPVKEENIKGHKELKGKETGEESLKRKIVDATRPLWSKFFWKLPYRIRWRIKDIVDLDNDDWGALGMEIGEENIKKYYQKDLRLALEHVQRLVEELDGELIVTADHGESLGENNEWGHKANSDNSFMYTVPWLEVEGTAEG